jgi:DNA-binding HxlR family transcriptional regulator
MNDMRAVPDQMRSPQIATMIEGYRDDRELMRSVLARTGDKWSVLIVVLLGGGAKRFTEIKHAIGGITQKVLTQTLRALERDGVIQRTPLPAMPARVKYELTRLGFSLLTAVQPLEAWAQTHARNVSTARTEYDKRERAKQGIDPARPWLHDGKPPPGARGLDAGCKAKKC